MRNDENGEDLDKRLRSLDDKTTWNPHYKAQLKKRVFDEMDRRRTSPDVAKKPWVYYAAFVTAVVIASILLLPFVMTPEDPSMLASSDRMMNEQVDGYGISVREVAEEDSGYALTVMIENNSDQYMRENEWFIKDFSGKSFDRTGPDVHQTGLKDMENGYVDPHSRMLRTFPDADDQNVIEPGETKEMLFHVNETFAKEDHYEVMYQSKLSPEADYGGELHYHVIDLQSELVGKYASSSKGSAGLWEYGALALATVMGITLVLRTGWTKGIRIGSSIGIIILITGGYLFITSYTEDEKALKEAAEASVQFPMLNVVHTEILDHDEAVVFYEWGGGSKYSFGSTTFERNMFGWSNHGGTSSEVTDLFRAGNSYLNLEMNGMNHLSLSHGYIIDDQVERVALSMDDRTFEGTVVKLDNDRRFWYYVSDEVNLSEADLQFFNYEGTELNLRKE